MTTPDTDRLTGEMPDGPAWAALLAAAIAVAVFGLTVDLAEAVHAVSAALVLYRPAGDLSGKATLAVVVWLAVWFALHRRWRRRRLRSTLSVGGAVVGLTLASLVMTFPPVVEGLARVVHF